MFNEFFSFNFPFYTALDESDMVFLCYYFFVFVWHPFSHETRNRTIVCESDFTAQFVDAKSSTSVV